ncbi:MAG: hypothetical protein LUD02_08545 [Tannerellaceae bacterium]|nr:hypothetical protein [Tannerellaceae bacterium]MCD8264188.1 hypothetical protein [Tannerellaceae bacterium]
MNTDKFNTLYEKVLEQCLPLKDRYIAFKDAVTTKKDNIVNSTAVTFETYIRDWVEDVMKDSEISNNVNLIANSIKAEFDELEKMSKKP